MADARTIMLAALHSRDGHALRHTHGELVEAILSALAAAGLKVVEAPVQIAGPPAMTPEEARRQAAIIMSSDAYTNRSDPGHQAAVERAQSLFDQAYAAPPQPKDSASD